MISSRFHHSRIRLDNGQPALVIECFASLYFRRPPASSRPRSRQPPVLQPAASPSVAARAFAGLAAFRQQAPSCLSSADIADCLHISVIQ